MKNSTGFTTASARGKSSTAYIPNSVLRGAGGGRGGISLAIDATDVSRLAKRVHNLGDKLSKQALPVSFKRGVSAAKTVAAREVVKAGGYHRAKQKAGLAAEVRGRFKARVNGLSGSIFVNDRWQNLAAWTAGGTRDNYRGKGVYVRGVYNKNIRLFDPNRAFIRSGKNGARLVFERVGARGMKSLVGPNSAILLRQEPTQVMVKERFFTAFDASVNRYIDKALASL